MAMFSNNRKISSRQLQALLLTDWMGKILLLLPALAGQMGGRNALAGTLAGTLLALGVGRLIVREEKCSGSSFHGNGGHRASGHGSGGHRASGHGSSGHGGGGYGGSSYGGRQEEVLYGGSYYAALERRLGRWAARTIYVLYGIYFLYHGALMTYLCGQVAAVYLLPEVDFAVVTLLPVLLGLYLAWSGLEVRGRVSELAALVIWVIFLGMILLAMSSFQPRQMALGGAQWDGGGFLICSLGVLLSCGTLGALPLVRDRVEDREGMKKRVLRATAMTGVLLFFVLLAGFGIFGSEGMARLRWPVISLMSSGSVKGVFLQRWDILLIGFLVFVLYLSAGEGIYYMGAVGRALGAKGGWPVFAGGAAVWLLCLGMNALPELALWGGAAAFLICLPVLLIAAVWMGCAAGRNAPAGKCQ